jgi:hypothetical protein
VIFSTAVPVFVSVTLLDELVVPTLRLAKVRLVGERLTVGAVVAAPVPVRTKVCGLPAALSATDTVAAREPVATGVNVKAMLHVPLAAIVPTVRQSVPLAGATSAKSPGLVPVIVTPVIVTELEPLLVSVEVRAALAVPCC